jgi:hypothetical protein
LCFLCVVSLVASPIPVAARSEVWVCGRSLDGVVGSNLADGMDLCCQVEVSASG